MIRCLDAETQDPKHHVLSTNGRAIKTSHSLFIAHRADAGLVTRNSFQIHKNLCN